MLSRRNKNILESKRKLNESWPSVLNSLSTYEKETVRNTLSRMNIDIENTPSGAIEVVSPRDPRLKTGMTIFDLGSGRNHIVVYINNKCVVDCDVIVPSGQYKRASQLSWSSLINMSDRIYHMDFDEASIAAMQALRKDRKDAKNLNGYPTRYRTRHVDGPYGGYNQTSDEYGNPVKNPRRLKIDKSGYELNPDKYVNMLAAAGVSNGEQILADAKEVYRQLAAIAPDHLEDERNGYLSDSTDYMDTLQYFARTFRNLKRDLDDYNKYKAEYGEEGAQWSRHSVQRSIKELRSYIQKAKELIAKG